MSKISKELKKLWFKFINRKQNRKHPCPACYYFDRWCFNLLEKILPDWELQIHSEGCMKTTFVFKRKIDKKIIKKIIAIEDIQDNVHYNKFSDFLREIKKEVDNEQDNNK